MRKATLLAWALLIGIGALAPDPAWAQAGGPGQGGGRGGMAPPTYVLTYEMAKAAAEAAEAEARRNNWNVIIIVTDENAIPLYLKRMTGTMLRAYDFAMGKARTVIASGLSTGEYAQQVAAGTIQAVPDAVALEGGFPIHINGQLAGAIAVSGLMPAQDAQVARAGLAAITGQ